MSFRALFEDARSRLDYWISVSQLDFASEVSRLLRKRKMTRAELARAIETSPAYVSKALSGDSNFTIATMVRVARALNAELRLQLVPVDQAVNWIDMTHTAIPKWAPETSTVSGLGASSLEPNQFASWKDVSSAYLQANQPPPGDVADRPAGDSFATAA